METKIFSIVIIVLLLHLLKTERVVYIDSLQSSPNENTMNCASLQNFFSNLDNQTIPNDLYRVFIKSDTFLAEPINLMSYTLDIR